jgi:hypothetical protein
MKVGNRLALAGEELVAHRFPSGFIGMVSRSDYRRWRAVLTNAPSAEGSLRNLLRRLLSAVATRLLSSDGEPPIVEFPSDALLRVYGISQKLQQEYHLSAMEDALFIELTPHIRSGDALCFGNGVMIWLQSLQEGQRVKVLYRSWAESLEPAPEPVQMNM